MFYFGAVLQRSSVEVEVLGLSNNENDWGLTLGVAQIEGLLITTDYMNEPGYNLNLTAKYVQKLEGDTAININASFIEGDEDSSLLGEAEDTTTLGIDYYFSRNVSLGVVFSDASESEYGVRTQIFFTQQFSVAAEYLTADSENIITVATALRF